MILQTYYNNRYDNGLKEIPQQYSIYHYILKQTLEKSKVTFKMSPHTFTREISHFDVISLLITSEYFKTLVSRVTDTQSILDPFLKHYTEFKEKYPEFTTDRMKCYKLVKIPKKKGGFRDTYAPIPELKELQNEALFLLDNSLGIKEHEVAHAYCHHKDNITNAEVHKHSKHFLKFDFKNFFPSISKNLLESTLSNIAEFAIINAEEKEIPFTGLIPFRTTMKNFFNALCDIATLNDFLPQGSPLSPKLSNLVMIEFDHKLLSYCLEKSASSTVIMYTRYADDITLSSLHPINKSLITQIIKEYLPSEIKLNEEKTVYLRNTNRLYITGVKINKDNNTTYGHEKTSLLKQDLFKLFISKSKGEDITETAREVLGQLSYAQRIEPQKVKLIIVKYCKKFNIPVSQIYKYLIN